MNNSGYTHDLAALQRYATVGEEIWWVGKYHVELEIKLIEKFETVTLSEDEIIVGRFVIRSWLATSDREIDRSKTTGIKYNPFLFIVLAY